MEINGTLPFSSTKLVNKGKKKITDCIDSSTTKKSLSKRKVNTSIETEEWWTVVIRLNRAKLFRYEIYPFQIRNAINRANIKGVWCMDNPMGDAAITLVISSNRAVNFDDSTIHQYVSTWNSSGGNDYLRTSSSKVEKSTKTKVTSSKKVQNYEREEVDNNRQDYIHLYIMERIIKTLMAENNTKNPKFGLISGIPGITDTTLQYDSNEQRWFIWTEGSNLPALYNHSLVDETRTISDDIHEIYDYLGISAVKNYLFRRLSAVSGFSGNNPAHLMLVIDHMTSDTTIKGLTRHGLDEENASPLGRMAFEQVGKNLTLATTTSAHEPLTGVSARVLIGQPVLVGTNGPFSITIKNTKKIKSNKQTVKRGAVPIGNKLGVLPYGSESATNDLHMEDSKENVIIELDDI